MGMGGTIQDLKNHKKSQQNSPYENCSHFWDIFRKMFKNIFQIYSYIQKTIQNPIDALKIITYSTKHTNNIKLYLETIQHFRETKKRAITQTNIFYYI